MSETNGGFIVAMVKRIGVGLGGIVAAAAVSLAAVPAAGADTINVVQKTRYWLDNSVSTNTDRSEMRIIALRLRIRMGGSKNIGMRGRRTARARAWAASRGTSRLRSTFCSRLAVGGPTLAGGAWRPPLAVVGEWV